MTIHIPVPLPRLVAPGGPVSRALRVMAEADPEAARIRELRRAIADRIEADLALLDALDGDPDLEADYHRCLLLPDRTLATAGFSTDDEPSLCGTTVAWPCQGGDDREDGDDNGIADPGGLIEQFAFRPAIAGRGVA